MQRGKTGKYDLRKWLPVWVVLSVWVTAMTGTAQAKSVYLLANTNAKVGYEEPISIFTVYPNPFKPNDQDADTGSWNTGVTFLNLAEGTAVRIYTLSGGLVRDSGAIDDGEWVWDGCNAAGTRVASGMYIYVAIYSFEGTPGKQKTGKVIVIR